MTALYQLQTMLLFDLICPVSPRHHCGTNKHSPLISIKQRMQPVSTAVTLKQMSPTIDEIDKIGQEEKNDFFLYTYSTCV